MSTQYERRHRRAPHTSHAASTIRAFAVRERAQTIVHGAWSAGEVPLMSGFDNGTMQGGVFFQTKQFGSVLRGSGPPVPQAGAVGDLYIDTQTWFLYNKRSNDAAGDVDPWGHYLFPVPDIYQARLKWFSAYPPTKDIGTDGDYCLLWGGYPNYGLQPSIFGPKAAGAWPANPVAVTVALNALYTAEDSHGV